MDEKLKRRVLIIVLIVLVSSYVNASNCKSYDLISSRHLNYDHSDLVALCRGIEENKIEIIECFKGGIAKGRSFIFSTHLNLQKNEVWLIYGKYKKENGNLIVEIDECSISRNVRDPIRIIVCVKDYELPQLTQDGNDKDFIFKINNLKKRALDDLNTELIWLNSMKSNMSFESLLKDDVSIKKKEVNLYNIFFATIIVLQILILFLIFFKAPSKRYNEKKK